MARFFSGTALALTLLLTAGCGYGGAAGTSAGTLSYAGKTLTLGAVLSLTGPGGVYGVNSNNGIDLAVAEINSHDGIEGARLAVKVRDDASDRQQAAKVTQDLIDDGVAGLIGPTLSNSAVTVHPLANSLRVPVVATSNSGLHIVPDCMYPDPQTCPYVFRVSLGEQAAIPANIRVWEQAHQSRTGVLLVVKDDKFSRDGGEIVKKAAPANGIRLLGTIEFSKSDTDLTAPIAEAVQLKPDVIFINSLGSIPARLMIGARKQGFEGEFLGGNGFNTAVVSREAGPAGEGAQSASAWYINSSDSSNKRFVTAYRSRYGIDPDQFAAQAYSGVYIYAMAARLAHLGFTKLEQDRSQLRDALEKVDLDTPLGHFRFTADHDVQQAFWVIQMDGKGGFRLVTSVNPA